MLANVSFGIFAFHPLGWALMLAVIGMEALALRALPGAQPRRNRFVVSLASNALSGIVGFVVSMGLTGGWWLVVWVPWVTANEASYKHWPKLIAFMGIAYVASVVIESYVVKSLLPHATTKHVVMVLAIANLASSIFLLAVFWTIGGVPGL